MARTPEDIHDELLVLRCQDGEVEALEELVGRWQDRLWRHARRLTDDRDAAADVLQEAWMAIVRGIRRLDDPALFPPWAYRIVTFKCADWTRRRQRDRTLVREAGEAKRETEQSASGNDAVDLVRDALAKMPIDQRAILSLHYLEGFAIAEIALVLDIPPGTVKSRLHHARNHLRSILERTSP